jgi:hypothetical protein
MVERIVWVATAGHTEAIVMRLSRTADELANGSRERLIEHTEQAAIDLQAAVRGR